jgi:uncharacterized repeat protein (TIGR01451 family)
MWTQARWRVALVVTFSQAVMSQTPSKLSLVASSDGTTLAMVATVMPVRATGRVTFYDGDAVLGATRLVRGRAVFPVSDGSDISSIRAHYSGDSTHSPSDSTVPLPRLPAGNKSARLTAKANAATPGPYLISTLAGNLYPPTSLPATSTVLQEVTDIAVDRSGNVYFTDEVLNMVFRLDSSGNLTRVAGQNPLEAVTPTNSPALNEPLAGLGDLAGGLAVDSAGNLYIGISADASVKRLAPNGTLTVVAGTGNCGGSPTDSGPATASMVCYPAGMAFDAAGNLYISDWLFHVVRKVTPDGMLTTVAGTGSPGYSGDGGAATAAELNYPWGLAVDNQGDLFIADTHNNRIREVLANGDIITVAGNGNYGYGGDDGPATQATLKQAQAVAVDSSGHLYIGDVYNCRIRLVSGGTITTVAGDGTCENYSNGSALNVSVAPYGMAMDSSGNIYVANYTLVREVSGGNVATIVGGGYTAGLAAPFAVFQRLGPAVADNAGNVYVADSGANCIYGIDPFGNLAVVAGSGVLATPGDSGDGGPATAAQLDAPLGLAVDSNGALYIAEYSNRVRKIAGGIITTIAGTGTPGFSGDGGAATAATLRYPEALAVDKFGNVFVADSGNLRIRKIAADGPISTVAGSGTFGYSGDGGAATAAQFDAPTGVSVDTAGNLYITDQFNNCIRMVTPNGVISTFAGTGVAGSLGDGGPATAAELDDPQTVAVDTAGNVFIADLGNDRVRVVNTAGIISTVAGNPTYPDVGPETGPALGADIGPRYVGITPGGAILVSGSVRLLTRQGVTPVLTVCSTHDDVFALGSAGQYTLTVSNLALAGATNGTAVTVTEVPPAKMSVLSMSGDGWDCNGSSCTRNDVLAGGQSYPAISAVVNVSSNAPSQLTNMVTAGGGGAATTGAEDLTVLTAPPTTINTNPTGLPINVDSLPSGTAPQTISLYPGPHSIAVSPVQTGTPGIQYLFTGWSDSGAASHTIIVTGTAATYTANFQTQYQLTTVALPEPGGAVSPASGAFFDAGSTVTLTATPIAPYTFTSWSGAASGTANATTITMNAAQAVTANFAVPGFTCAVTGDVMASVADVQLIVNEALGANAPTNDMNRDGVVNVADVQKVIQAAMGAGCLY